MNLASTRRISDAPFDNAPYVEYLSRRASDSHGYSAEQCKADLLKTAEKHRHLSGKWFVFPSQEKVDELWLKIATATVEGKLGSSAKVGPRDPHGRGRCLICVYVFNSFDMDEVGRVLHALQGMGIDPKTFKPDV